MLLRMQQMAEALQEHLLVVLGEIELDPGAVDHLLGALLLARPDQRAGQLDRAVDGRRLALAEPFQDVLRLQVFRHRPLGLLGQGVAQRPVRIGLEEVAHFLEVAARPRPGQVQPLDDLGRQRVLAGLGDAARFLPAVLFDLAEGLLVDREVTAAEPARIGAGRMVRKQERGRSQDDRDKTEQTPHFGPHKQLYLHLNHRVPAGQFGQRPTPGGRLWQRKP